MKKNIEIPKKTALFCMGSKCHEINKEVIKDLKHNLKESGHKKDIIIVKTECLGKCKHAPIACMQPKNKWFSDIKEKKLKKKFEKWVNEDSKV